MPRLFLIPNTIASTKDVSMIPAYVAAQIPHVRHFMVEEEKEARALLKHLFPNLIISECTFFALNEHADMSEAKKFFETHINQFDVGIISESGVPCVADPGSEVVLWAHQKNIDVVPFVGPSSILLAVMASGLSGQNFAFNGYLPKEVSDRMRVIKNLEKRSLDEAQTQIFMETPYRNEKMFKELIDILHPETMLSVACDIMGKDSCIKTYTVKEWRSKTISLHKKPALFLIQRTS